MLLFVILEKKSYSPLKPVMHYFRRTWIENSPLLLLGLARTTCLISKLFLTNIFPVLRKRSASQTRIFSFAEHERNTKLLRCDSLCQPCAKLKVSFLLFQYRTNSGRKLPILEFLCNCVENFIMCYLSSFSKT
jgi:hypothetical protein